MPTIAPLLSRCPCGNLRPYSDCCGRFHGGEPVDTALKLMRSRYCAYVLRRQDYLLATWHASTRPAEVSLADPATMHWLGLEVRSQQETANSARIEFIARFRLGDGQVQGQHEISRFVREGGQWFYVDGEFPPPPAPFTERRKTDRL